MDASSSKLAPEKTQAKSRGKKIGKLTSNVVGKARGIKEQAHKKELTQEPEDNTPEGSIFVQLKTVLDILQSLCQLELKLKYKDWRFALVKTAKHAKVISCRLIFDVNRGGVRVKVHMPKLLSLASAVAMPMAVQTALATLNTVLSNIPNKCPSVIRKLFEKVLVHVLSSIKLSGKNGEGTSNTGPVTLTQALSRVDIGVILSRDVKCDIWKKDIFSPLTRSQTTLDIRDKQNIEVLKVPRNLFRQKLKEESITFMMDWVEGCSVASGGRGKAISDVLRVVKTLVAPQPDV